MEGPSHISARRVFYIHRMGNIPHIRARQDFQRGCTSFSVRRNTDYTTGGPYPFHAPPANDYMPPPEQHFETPINDYPVMSMHFTNL